MGSGTYDRVSRLYWGSVPSGAPPEFEADAGPSEPTCWVAWFAFAGAAAGTESPAVVFASVTILRTG